MSATDRRGKHPDFFRLAKGLLGGTIDLSGDYQHFGTADITPTALEDATVVTSRVGAGTRHKLAIDIDMDATLLESSTKGHFHLYVDHEMPWEHYQELLTVLRKVGLIEQGYLDASIKRGFTVLRTPWTRKDA